MTEPEFTRHAAKRVVQRKLDRARVLEIARAIITAGLARNGEARMSQGGITVVVAGGKIITCYDKHANRKPRKARR